MQRHFEQELQSLKTTIIKMGSLAEESMRRSVRSLVDYDVHLAEAIIGEDDRINGLEIEIDNAIVDLLALQQPVATDLRLILAAQKINNDLERIGDHAVNISESVIALITLDPKRQHQLPKEITEMAQFVEKMLREALDGFIHNDPALGVRVLQNDDRVDDLNRMLVRNAIQAMKDGKTPVDIGMEMSRISRNFERVADLATNIAEEVIFISQARVVKHHAEEKSPQKP
jgi:phosphate transport system protein